MFRRPAFGRHVACQCSEWAIVPGNSHFVSGYFGGIFLNWGTQSRLQMTLTVAHISPLMSLVAGLLILIMPRLLNLIIAVFLILNGLIGLGLLKWLHL